MILTLFYLAFFLVSASTGGLNKKNASEVKDKNEACFNLRCPAELPRTCKDVMNSKRRVTVTLWDGHEVRCETQSDGGGWMIIQRRTSGHLNFYKNWKKYKEGFGEITGEFWLGNEQIHKVSSRSPHELRIDFRSNGKEYFARYSFFRVLSEAEDYRLLVDGYSGNAGDSLTKHNDQKFSTKDRDNDKSSSYKCAEAYHGAWWYYNSCHTSNLNGHWQSTEHGKGLNWETLTGFNASVTFSEMKIRPIH